MAKNVLAVIDMQNDFIDGALGTKEAEAIVGNVTACIRDFDGEVICTRDPTTMIILIRRRGRNFPYPTVSRIQRGGRFASR